MKLFEFDHTIKSNGKEHLPDIISDEEYKNWFNTRKGGKIFVLNKGRCGNGGTTGFINYAKRNFKGLSIIVPNVSIVQSKEWDNELCCLYGGKEIEDRNKPIRVATWDKHKILETLPSFGMDLDNRFWAGSLLVIDEYHKLVDDCKFRGICAKVVKTIIETKSNVVLMSATPNIGIVEFLREVSGKEVITYNVEYDDKVIPTLQWMDRKKGQKLYNVVGEIIDAAREKKSKSQVHQVVFFYNNVDGITDIVNQLENSSDVEVLCSKNRDKKTIPCYSEKFNKDKIFHFCTSAYFTGMDIDEYIDKVVIIGGNSQSILSYSNKEIKQMLGRMRKGYNGSFIIPDGRAINKNIYYDFKAKKERNGFNINLIGGDTRREIMYIQQYLEYLYYGNIVENMEGWQNFESFKKMMAIYPEYEVINSKMKEPRNFGRKRDISFKVYKEKRLKGEIVPYRYQAICEKYIKLCGLEKFKKATRNQIERYVKINDKSGDTNMDLLNGEEKYNLFVGDGFYRGSYLMSVLDFLGEKCDYDNLEKKMNEVFGCFCIYDSGKTGKKRECLYLCLMVNKLCFLNKRVEQGGKIGDTPLLYKKEKIVPDFAPLKHPTRISKKTSTIKGTNYSITDYLLTTDYKSLLDTEHKEKFFSKILDNLSIILGIKETTDWREVFNKYKKEQTMISEFYKDVPPTTQYPHHKDEMEYIDCLIVDIDDSISYNEFQKIYENFEFIAYPSISNPDKEDWKKFRVIFPLSNTLSIPNDSLKVLKLLRRMVCKYEDKNHNLGAYINKEQWEMRIENEGKPVEISQDMVVYLDTLLKTDPITTKFKISKDGSVTTTYWTLERAIQYYNIRDKDNERHKSLYPIMNHLSLDDCKIFENWLKENHYRVWAKHWKTHKRDRKD